MLYLELLAELSDHLVVEIGTIIRNDPLRYTVSTDQVVPTTSSSRSQYSSLFL